MATKIRGAQINDTIAGAGLELTASGILNILVDDSSIEINVDTLQVKAGGITNTMLVNDSVTVTAGDALSGGGEVDLGSSITLDVVVDGTTISNAGDQLSVIASGIDHGSLADLGADDHTQYILADGTRAFSGIFESVGMELTEGDVKLFASPADSDVSGITASGTTAATFGQVVYVDGSGNYVAAKADASATMPTVALVTAVSNEVMTAGYATDSGWSWTPGGLLYVSDATAGDMTQTAPTASGSQVQIVGVAISATTIYFNPDVTTVELGDSPFYTKEEVDALITTSSGDILSYISANYIDNSEMTTISGDILSYVSSNYIDNSEMTTISGDIISYLTSTSGVIDHGNLAGLADDDHTQYLLADGSRALSGDLLPNASGTVDLGSAALPYAEIHVDDIYVKGASIHLGGYEISEFSNDDTLADDSTTALPTEYAVKNYVATVSGGLENNIIWEVVDTPTDQIRPKAAHMGKAIYTSGNVTIGGDLTVTGTIFYTDTEHVLVSDNIMILNYGESGAGVTAVTAGIQIDRGSEEDYQFLFDERNDTFRVGVSGSQDAFNDYPLQPVATREDSPTDTRVPWWDAASYTFRTQGDTYERIIVASGGGGQIDLFVDGVQEVYVGGETISIGYSSGNTNLMVHKYVAPEAPSEVKVYISETSANEFTVASGGINVKNSTVYVNEILNTVDADSISISSTDAQLATAKLIYNYTNTVSGAVLHNNRPDLQGGNGSDEYYHLDLTAFTALSGVDGTQVGQWDTAYSHTLSTSNPHSVTYTQVGAIQDSTDTVKDTHIDWGIGANQVDLDDVPDGSTYERVLGTQLNSGIYIDASTSIKGIASFSSDNFAVTSGAVSIKDDGIAEAELVIANAPTDGYYLQYTTASGMKWMDVSTEGVLESDYQLDNLSSSCNDVTTQFYLSYIPVQNSLQVYLNGLLQEKGGGLDYTSTSSGVLFTTAPLTGDILIAHYVRTSV